MTSEYVNSCHEKDNSTIPVRVAILVILLTEGFKLLFIYFIDFLVKHSVLFDVFGVSFCFIFCFFFCLVFVLFLSFRL